MIASLRWQVVWPQVMLIMLTAASVGASLRHAQRVTARHQAVASARDRLDRAITLIADRHTRTVNRVRAALVTPSIDARRAMVTAAAASYLPELERFITAAVYSLRTVEIPDAGPRLGTEIARIEKQMERVTAQTQALSDSLLTLRESFALDDPEAMAEAQRTLQRADRAVVNAINNAVSMTRRAMSWQARHAPEPAGNVPPWAWACLAAWAITALWLSQRHAARLHRIAAGRLTSPPKNSVEQLLIARIDALESARVGLEDAAADNNRTTERLQHLTRRTERELALLQLYNENLVNSLRSCVVVMDAAGTVTAFNRAARTLFGLSESDIETPLDRLPLFAAVEARSGSGGFDQDGALADKQVRRLEGVPYPADEPTLVLDLTIAPYLDESGAARGLLWVADDVTEQLETKRQLLGAERLAAVGRLSAQVAHEIRNPLSAIALNAELLEEEIQRGIHDDQRRGEAGHLLKAMTSEIERLTEVTDGYLHLARLPHPNPRPVQVNQLVGELFTMLAEEMRAHAITVKLDLARDLPPVAADPGQLRQALLNVVRNGREAMSRGGCMRVTTRGADAAVEILITDDGPGIAADEKDRIFEPFFSTKPAGTGLGLSITHQIVSEHGGSIRFETGNTGTTFVIRIPTP